MDGIGSRLARMPLVAAVFTVLGTAERLSAFVRQPAERDVERRVAPRATKKDFCDALYHLDQLSVAPASLDRLKHRLALERILLAAYADHRDDEWPALSA